MFVRARTRFEDGKRHRCWSVVENHRDRNGRVAQRQVPCLGEIDDGRRAARCRSIEAVDGESSSKRMALFPPDREAPELWSADRFEYGWTHAYAGAADWLALHDERSDPNAKLSCILESVGHIADDALRQPRHPFDEGGEAYDEDGFVAAVEAEDALRATRLARGGFGAGGFDTLERGFVRAALAHYANFGHSLIYVDKARSLCSRLAPKAGEAAALSLARSLCYARREDQIPEFAHYGTALARWPAVQSVPSRSPMAEDFRQSGIRSALERTVDFARADPQRLHAALLGAAAWNMLAFDLHQAERTSGSISANVS